MNAERGSLAIVWRYQVDPERVGEFEERYGPAGDWARLFARADGYRGTEFLKDQNEPLVYLTIDRWVSEAAFASFRERYELEYRELDTSCDALTNVETRVGSFTALD